MTGAQEETIMQSVVILQEDKLLGPSTELNLIVVASHF